MLPLAFAAFVAFGVVLVLVGANQAELARVLGLDLEASGLLGATLSLGIGVGVLASGPVVDRLPRRPLFVAASFGAAALLGSVGESTGFPRALATVGLLGACVGAYETLLNTVVAERYRAAAARPLTVVHIGATVGAVLGAPLLAAIGRWAGWHASFRLTGVAFAAIGLAALLVSLERRPEDVVRADPGRRISLAIVPFACVVACYVGVETALTLFAVPWAVEGVGVGPERGVVSISAFWLGLLGGRLLFAVRGGAGGAGLVVASGAAAALLLLAAVATRLPQPELVLAAVGLTLGAVFPVFVALAAERFAAARGTATGLVTGAGAAGGFAVPWLTGAIGDRAGILAAFTALGVCCLLMACAAWIPQRRARAPASTR